MPDQLKIQPTTTLTIDNSTFVVEKMSPAVQQMVSFLDAWRQKEIDATVELSMIKAALRDLQQNIYVSVKKEREEAMKKAKDMGIVKDAPEAANEAAPEAPFDEISE